MYLNDAGYIRYLYTYKTIFNRENINATGKKASTERTNFMFMYHENNTRKYHNITIAN